jgi:hypothetical protein
MVERSENASVQNFTRCWTAGLTEYGVTMTDRELMDKAWDYLASYTVGERPNASEVNDLIAVIEDRMNQPVGFMDSKLNPIKRQWVGLDDEEYQTILGQLGDGGLLAFYILIESKLKEKNT